MTPYHLDPNVCPSSLHENEQGELEPMTQGETAHKWDDSTDPPTCSECGAEAPRCRECRDVLPEGNTSGACSDDCATSFYEKH